MSVAPFPRGVPVATGEFRINEFTRAYDDKCEVAQHNRDSGGPGKYQVTNLVPKQSAAASIEYINPTLLGREGFGYNNQYGATYFLYVTYWTCLLQVRMGSLFPSSPNVT